MIRSSCDVALGILGGGWGIGDLPCADLGLLFPEPPEPSDRVALERGTIGISEESGTESRDYAHHGAPKALREGLVGEASASRVKVNMLTASLGKAPEATFQLMGFLAQFRFSS